MAGLLGVGLLAGCNNRSSQQPGTGQSGASQQQQVPQDQAKAAQQQGQQALDQARDAQKRAQDAQANAQDAQKSISGDQQDLNKDQQKLNADQQKAEQARAQAQQAQQNAEQQSKQASQTVQQSNQRAAQAQQEQAQSAQQRQQQFAQQQQAGAAAGASSQGEQLKTAEGTVSKVANRQLTLNLSGQAPLQLQTGSSTRVFIDGQPGSLGDLQQGTDVRVAYKPGSSGQNLAQRIDASTQGSP